MKNCWERKNDKNKTKHEKELKKEKQKKKVKDEQKMRRKAIFILLNGLLHRGVHLICIQWHVFLCLKLFLRSTLQLMDIFNVSKWATTTKYFQKSLLSTKEGRKHKHLLMISFLGQVYFQSVISILTVPHRPQTCF